MANWCLVKTSTMVTMKHCNDDNKVLIGSVTYKQEEEDIKNLDDFAVNKSDNKSCLPAGKVHIAGR